MKNPIFSMAPPGADSPLPFRNYRCPEYDPCLTAAAVKNMHLDCSLCELKDSEAEIVLHLWELPAYNRLLAAVFCP